MKSKEETLFFVFLGIAVLIGLYSYFEFSSLESSAMRRNLSINNLSLCTVLDSDSIYILAKNITSQTTCFILNSQTTLDCNGFYITGAGKNTGIEIIGSNNRIKNCFVENFSSGILIRFGFNNSITETEVKNYIPRAR